MTKSVKLGLVAGRHDLGDVDGYVFNQVDDVFDFDAMFATANAAVGDDVDHVDLFVTGLTSAALAVAAVCSLRKVSLDCWHFDRDTGVFHKQTVLSFQRCGFCGHAVSASDRVCPNCGG